MEPKQSAPEFSPVTPESNVNGNTPERTSQPVEFGRERGNETTAERAGEHAAQAQATVAAQATPVVLPTPVMVGQSVQSPPAQNDDLPAVAGDDDLIEKEWVDKAKQIISATRDDPARREKEVSRLQADYLKKRYGKELGAPSE